MNVKNGMKIGSQKRKKKRTKRSHRPREWLYEKEK